MITTITIIANIFVVLAVVAVIAYTYLAYRSHKRALDAWQRTVDAQTDLVRGYRQLCRHAGIEPEYNPTYDDETHRPEKEDT
jgi:hypothetical protein